MTETGCHCRGAAVAEFARITRGSRVLVAGTLGRGWSHERRRECVPMSASPAARNMNGGYVSLAMLHWRTDRRRLGSGPAPSELTRAALR